MKNIIIAALLSYLLLQSITIVGWHCADEGKLIMLHIDMWGMFIVMNMIAKELKK